MFLFFSLCCYYDHFSDRLKELFKVKNDLTTSFFLENAENLGRSDDAKRRKKRGWPNEIDCFAVANTYIQD